jgi:N-acetylmuramoyl-L-alanine amidase
MDPRIMLEGSMLFGFLRQALTRGPQVVLTLIAAVCAFSMTGPVIAWSASLTGLRHSTSETKTRVVLDLSDRIQFTHRMLSNPPRVVVDLPDGAVGPGVRARVIDNGFVKTVRLNELRSGRVQVVLDLERALDYSIFALDKPDRIVVDMKHPDTPAQSPKPKPVVEAKETTEKKTGTRTERAPATVKTTEPEPRSVEKKEPPSQRKESLPPPIPVTPRNGWVVAIDAGHGGEDHGASYHDTKEKEITLALAKELKKKLEKKPGIRVILVRKGDYFIPLRRRWTLAEKQGADLFVSIHCNASKNRKAEGTEVFFLSLKGATDEAAQELAHRENAVDEKMGVTIPEDELNEIIFDMMQTDVLAKSQMLAEVSLDHLFALGTVHDRGVKQAGFAVLKSPRMPSILVEAAFISNRKENKMLRDSSWRKEFSGRLSDGIASYIQDVDPGMKAER